jgi:DNA-binding NarL/FixJ family response regulator
MTDSPLQILIADDHAIVRTGVRQTLGSALRAEFHEARDSRAALELARAQRFDLIVIDVSMPGRSGLDILLELRSHQPDVPLLVFSMHSEDQFALRALKAGASGYIAKGTDPQELLRAAQKVLAGGRYVSGSLAETLAELVHSGVPHATHEALSGREFEVLRLIVSGCSGKEIAAELSLSFKTVSTYRTRILAKLGVGSNAELAQYAMREGLIP